LKRDLFKRFLLSSLIFKSVLIGGGYATGRELVEFFLSRGPVTGFLGMLVAAAIFSVVLCITFELARRYRLYDYRTFLKKLLGPGWIVYEIAFLALLMLILSVLSAAAGEIVAGQFGVAPFVGTLIQMLLVASIVFYGTSLIERFFTAWSFVLYGAFAVFFVWAAIALGPDIEAHWRASVASSGAFTSGVLYAGYSMAVIPTMLYCARHFPTLRCRGVGPTGRPRCHDTGYAVLLRHGRALPRNQHSTCPERLHADAVACSILPSDISGNHLRYTRGGG